MAIKRIKIAIISDLHCHPKRTKTEEGQDETYLLTDKLRSPSNDHPVESLIKIIEEKKIKVDLTLCPGDFTDKANVQGFIAGWNYSLEISRELNSKEIVATLGNHDVDVYNNHSNYSLDIAKGIKQRFPFVGEDECNTYWAKGCAFLEREDYRILVINSSHFHHNKANSKSGKVDNELIDYVKEYLKEHSDDKINIAMSHHQPVEHSQKKLGEDDKILNAHELLEVLGDNNFDIFIHGHKHDALIRYHKTTKGNHQIPIFSSGSFSSCSNLMFTSERNSFHVITITKDKKSKGEIETWTYFPNSGWEQNFDEKGFAPFTGFGSEKTVGTIFNELKQMLGGLPKMTWDEITTQISDISNLLPEEAKELHELLNANSYIFDQHIWKKPNTLHNVNDNL